jgi:hypothetical protein
MDTMRYPVRTRSRGDPAWEASTMSDNAAQVPLVDSTLGDTHHVCAGVAAV